MLEVVSVVLNYWIIKFCLPDLCVFLLFMKLMCSGTLPESVSVTNHDGGEEKCCQGDIQ